jgi:hypothetical protein
MRRLFATGTSCGWVLDRTTPWSNPGVTEVNAVINTVMLTTSSAPHGSARL